MAWKMTWTVISHCGKVTVIQRHYPTRKIAQEIGEMVLDSVNRESVKHTDVVIEKVGE